MLLGLVLRGVAFEFRFRSIRRRRWRDRGFVLGSLVAALAQGVALGAILQGVAVEGRAYAGGWLDWLTPFTAPGTAGQPGRRLSRGTTVPEKSPLHGTAQSLGS